MTKQIAPLTQRQAWKALEAHHTSVREFHLRKLFADDPKRGERMTAEALGLYLDYSKNRITDETLKLLLQLAEESGLRERIDAMLPGRENAPHGRTAPSCNVALARAERSIDLSSMALSGTLVPQVQWGVDKKADWPNALSRN